MSSSPSGKRLSWAGSSRKDVREFPEEVKDVIGFALFVERLFGILNRLGHNIEVRTSEKE